MRKNKCKLVGRLPRLMLVVLVLAMVQPIALSFAADAASGNPGVTTQLTIQQHVLTNQVNEIKLYVSGAEDVYGLSLDYQYNAEDFTLTDASGVALKSGKEQGVIDPNGLKGQKLMTINHSKPGLLSVGAHFYGKQPGIAMQDKTLVITFYMKANQGKGLAAVRHAVKGNSDLSPKGDVLVFKLADHKGKKIEFRAQGVINGDFNSDGKVDEGDLAVFSKGFGEPDLTGVRDYNGDRVVDVLDLMELADVFQ